MIQKICRRIQDQKKEIVKQREKKRNKTKRKKPKKQSDSCAVTPTKNTDFTPRHQRERRQTTAPTHLVLGEGEQRGEALATYGTHVVFGGAAVRLGVLAEAVLREEGPGADVALVVPLDEVGLLLPGAWRGGNEARRERLSEACATVCF